MYKIILNDKHNYFYNINNGYIYIYMYLYLNFFIIFYNLCDLKLILQQFVIFILKIINYFNHI